MLTTILTLLFLTGCAMTAPGSTATAPASAPVTLQATAAPTPSTPMSAATTSPVMMPVSLKFSHDSIVAIQSGGKTATVRKGIRAFPGGVIKAVSGGGEPVILQNVVATPKKVSDLTDADARANDSDSLDELKDDLLRDYPGIQPGDIVTVITFRVAPANPQK